MPGTVPSPAETRSALARVLASPPFVRADRARRLLTHLVTRALDGHADDLKEYALAVDVFGRADYDPKVDSLVRVEMAKLRDLLAKYDEGLGASDPVRIELVRGSYVPRFHARSSAPGALGGSTGENEGEAAGVVGPVVQEGAVDAGLPVAAAARRATRTRTWSPPLLALGASVLFAAGGGLWWLATRPAAREAVSPPPLASLAVLPFQDLSPDGSQQVLADGLTEEVIGLLVEGGGLRVPSRTTVFRYRRQPVDVRDIGRDLGVSAVLEGSVRAGGDAVRVTAQVIDTASGFHVWSANFEHPLAPGRVVAQEAVARQIADVLHAPLLPVIRALSDPVPADANARQFYLRGMVAQNVGPDLRSAADFFRRAARLAPAYAQAWVALAETLVAMADWRVARPVDVLPEANDAATRAVTLGGGGARAHKALANVHALYGNDLAQAEAAYRRALDLDPTLVDARLWYARYVLRPQRRLDEAVEQLGRALGVDPGALATRIELARLHLLRGELDRADEELSRAFSSGAAAPAAEVVAGLVAEQRGDTAEMLRRFSRAAELQPSNPWTLGHYGYGLAKADRADEARRVLARIDAMRNPLAAVDTAVVRAALGDEAAALADLVSAREAGVRLPADDARFGTLRTTAEFRALVRGQR